MKKGIWSKILVFLGVLTLVLPGCGFGQKDELQTNAEQCEKYCDLVREMVDSYKIKGTTVRTASGGYEVEYGEYATARLIAKGTVSGKELSKKVGAMSYFTDMNGYYVMQFESEEKAEQAYFAMQDMREVTELEIDRLVWAEGTAETQDDTTVQTTGISASGGHISWGVQRIGADDFINRMSRTQQSNRVIVAVVDTGISSGHPFLSGRMVAGSSMYSGSSDDDNGHGTHVAGIIADSTSGTGVLVMPVKVLEASGSGSTVTVAAGIRWATTNGASVINMSLGGYDYSSSHYIDSAVSEALNKGVTVVVSSGNDGSTTDYFCPAHVSGALCVGAIDSNDKIAYFSNYGSAVKLTAPGVDIYSAYPGNDYVYLSGTSMAAPFASAAAALVKAAHPSMTPSEIGNALTGGSDDRGTTGWDAYYGYGVVNLRNVSTTDDYAQLPDDTPSNPGSPDYPTNPGQPDTPVTPGYPTNPGQPDTPGYPDTPNPGTPGTSPLYPWDEEGFDWGSFDWDAWWEEFYSWEGWEWGDDDTPAVPDNPATPDNPGNPSNPSNPGNPSDPGNPAYPWDEEDFDWAGFDWDAWWEEFYSWEGWGWGEDDTPSTPTEPVNPGTPSTPAEPGNPGTPSTPAEPSNPGTPSTPAEPSNPGTPGTPAEPGNPGTPSTPAEPGNPGTPNTPAEPGNPGTPSTPAEPGNPGTPSTPAEPGNPGTPSTPVNPGNPGTPSQPVTPPPSNPYVPASISVGISCGSTNGVGYATLTITTGADISQVSILADGVSCNSRVVNQGGGVYTVDLSYLGSGSHSYSVTYGGSCSSGSFSF